jgi:hypothetical protein
MANLSKVREETEVVEVVEDDPYDMKPVWTAPPLSEKEEALIDKTNGASNVDKLLDLPQVWEGLKEPQGLQKPKGIAVHRFFLCPFWVLVLIWGGMFEGDFNYQLGVMFSVFICSCSAAL